MDHRPVVTVKYAVDKTHVVVFTPLTTPFEVNCKLSRAPSRPQHIVEVVSDAACQLSHGFHLLSLPKLAFKTFATRDLVKRP